MIGMIPFIIWGTVFGLILSLIFLLLLYCFCEHQNRIEYHVEYKPRNSQQHQQSTQINIFPNKHQQQNVIQPSIPRRENVILDVEESEEENISYSGGNEVIQPTESFLNKKAITKHIAPNCYTDQDAIRKCEERERNYGLEFVNTVFRQV